MRTFYELHVHRKDGSWRHHITRGEVPKVGDNVSATLAAGRVIAKVGAVKDPRVHSLRERGEVVTEVHADEV
jgi:hypothetical protein